MNGRQLYERYATLWNTLNNCEVDAWHDLSEDEQKVWNALGESVSESK